MSGCLYYHRMDSANKKIPEEVDRLILEDDKPGAVKLLCEHLEIGFAEAYELFKERRNFLNAKGGKTFEELDQTVQIEIDELIFEGHILKGMICMKENMHIGLKEAMECYYDRYELLKESDPERFKEKDSSEYWSGFYS